MLLDTIPSDILLLIINNLECYDIISLLKVNKYFNKFIENNKNYINSNSSINIHFMNDKDINYLVSKLPNVKHKYFLKLCYTGYNEQDYYRYLYFNNNLIKYSNYIYDLSLAHCKNINSININSSSILTIDLSYTSISDLSFLKNINSINKLVLRDCKKITDFSVLENCKNINYLDLSHTLISDLSFLKNNKSINKLILEYCRMLQDISILSSCKNITYIDLSSCSMPDISVLGMLENINYIKLFSYKKQLDLSFLEKCKNIDTLILSNTSLTDTSKIKNIKPNSHIDLSWTNITFITDMGKVNYLNLSNCNQLRDVSNLKNSQINFLNLSYSDKINDISMLSHIKKIKIRRCYAININGINNYEL